MRKRHFLAGLAGLGGTAALLPPADGQTRGAASAGFAHNVRDYGAAGDGRTLDTRAIQAAVDACGAAGGVVWFPPGRYLSGTILLRSNVTIELDAGAVLLGSKKLEDYLKCIPALRSYTDNYVERSLIYGENLERVALRGQGVIDGQGAAFKGPYKVRPYLIRLVSCREVTVRDLVLRDSPMWVQHYLACDDLIMDGLKVFSRCNANNDGIDIDGCQRVVIANCNISSGDDAIVLKSTLNRPCRDVVIANCVLSSLCNAFKLGTESNGGFENIVLTNCVMHDTRLAGIALELVDGGVLDRVNVSNVVMRQVNCPIFIRLGNRARPFNDAAPKPTMGSLRNLSIAHVQADGADKIGCSITGLPGHPVENVVLDDIRLGFAGGGTAADAKREVPEHAEKYPEYSMFGALPAYGLYCRHAKGVRLSNVTLTSAQPDARPPLVAEDLEGLDIAGLRAAPAADQVVTLRDARRVMVHGCASPKASAFARVEGRQSGAIKLFANELSEAEQAVALGPEVSSEAVRLLP